MTASDNSKATIETPGKAPEAAKTWGQLQHNIRNLLNAIKLNCAILQRRPGGDEMVRESLKEIEQSADNINSLITEFDTTRK